MKRVINKLIPVLISFIIISSILAGCSFQKGNKKDDEVLSITPEQKELIFFFNGTEPKAAKKVLGEVEAKLKSTLNVKLNFNWISGRDYAGQLKTHMESGKQIDAFEVRGNGQNDLLNALVKEDTLMDITSLFKQKAPKLYEMYNEQVLANVMYQGKIMGIPDNYPRSGRICAIMKETTAQKYNIQSIKNYEDFEKLLELLKNSNDGKLPVGFNRDTLGLFGEAYGYINIGNRLVYRQDDPQMKLIPWEQTKEFKQAASKLKDWIDNKYTSASLIRTMTAMNPVDAITRDMASSVLVDWDTAQAYLHTHTGSSVNLKVIPLYNDKMSARPGDYSAIVLNKITKNAERILNFVQWIQTSQENYDLFMYGIKGENYVLEGDRIKFPDEKSRYFGWDGCTSFININFTHLSVSDRSDFREEYKKVTESGTRLAPSTGFKGDYSKLQNVINARNDSYNAMNTRIFMFGANENDIDNFISENKALGVDTLVQDLQKQLDQWKSKK